MAICYSGLNDYEKVIEFATKSLEFNPEYNKALINRAKAHENLKQYEESLNDFKKVSLKDPSFEYKVKELEKKNEIDMEEKKKELFSNLKSFGNTILGKFGLSTDNFKLNQNEGGSYNISFQQ